MRPTLIQLRTAVLSGLLLLLSADALAQAVRWSDALEHPRQWYATAEAVRIADNVVLYQHPNGGWPKNIDMSKELDQADRERIRIEQADRETTIGQTTIDNGATHTQIRFLARVYQQTGHERFKQAAERGLDFLLEAQYDNGGWPQFFPLRDGYYDRITFNDDAMIGAMRVLRSVAAGTAPFVFLDAEYRAAAGESVARGLEIVLQTQVIQNGQPTVWCAQYDEHTLQPAWARAYEPPSLSGRESVEIVRYLMSIDDPSEEIIDAVEAAVDWFEEVAIHGYRLESFVDEYGNEDRRVVADPDAGPLWARFYQLGTNRPIFLGRESVVRYALSEIEQERRTGYSYYGDWAVQLLEEEYPAWRTRVMQGARR